MSDPVAVVFGGTGAIGKGIAHALADDGFRVVVSDIGATGPDLSALSGEGHDYVQCDVTDIDGVRRVFAPGSLGGAAAAVVYAAGVNYTGPVVTTDWSAFDRLQSVNLKGAFHVAAAAQELAQPQAYVFIASVAGLSGEAGGSVYCSTKFGLLGFVQSFAAEIAKSGARANAVCPGNVDSPLLRALAGSVAEREATTPDEILTRFAADSAFERLISIAEVADATAFLVSQKASGISGQSLVVDGPPN
ncbi:MULTISPECIES: SDR family NAD(P)-dependent oxidoreductase [unclassified Leucobacter]|uniref:SDR family NAD(P)-dependent oxidoreductase n=1 Tax=unclassified Leucobacter TaxID=2621730 RepID=UPI00165DB4D8|nr:MULTISPECIES: SDR family oxidoreductase [unclassified Leucobacter]MBC9935832.1 SDR family oxidoreductase [Leucobacter sp. cx-87]